MATVAAPPITVEEFERMGNRLQMDRAEAALLELPDAGYRNRILGVRLSSLFQEWLNRHAEVELTIEVRGENVYCIQRDQPSVVTSQQQPGLIIELISPDDLWSDVYDKVTEYLGIGVKEVWVVDGTKRRVDVFRPDAGPQRYTDADVLTSPDVLPGLSTPVAEMFRNV